MIMFKEMSFSSCLKWAAVFAFQAGLSVAAGAFGAHSLQDRLSSHAIAWWQTASQYLMYHSLAGLICSAFFLFLLKQNLSVSSKAFLLFLLGNIFFAGSLYTMALTEYRLLGAITPLGGFCYLLGWGYLVFKLWQSSQRLL